MTELKSSKKRKRIQVKTSPEYKELKAEKDLFRRRMFFLALLAKKMKESSGDGVDAILVGGEAIDLYTAGMFSTSDIDLVVNNKAITEKLLNRFGFGKQDNGLWLNRELGIVIQVIAAPYSGDTEKLRKFKIKGFELKVAAPEDLIANRLYSAKFWKSNIQRDLEQTVSLLRIFSDTIDNRYLDGLVKRDDTEDFLAQVREIASQK